MKLCYLIYPTRPTDPTRSFCNFERTNYLTERLIIHIKSGFITYICAYLDYIQSGRSVALCESEEMIEATLYKLGSTAIALERIDELLLARLARDLDRK